MVNRACYTTTCRQASAHTKGKPAVAVKITALVLSIAPAATANLRMEPGVISCPARVSCKRLSLLSAMRRWLSEKKCMHDTMTAAFANYAGHRGRPHSPWQRE